jgi:bacterioferritin-associated ferredoxin
MSAREPKQAPCFICRCEEITLVDLEGAIAGGARTINDVKRRTRAGMGVCQGAYCLEHVAALVSDRTGTPIEFVVPMTARPPARWITLSALAGSDLDRLDSARTVGTGRTRIRPGILPVRHDRLVIVSSREA